MRIAFVSVMAGSPWAASEVLWAETARIACREGHEVLVSTFDWPHTPSEIAELAQLGARIHQRPLSRWYRRSALLTRIDRSFDALETFEPDVICVNQGGTYDIARSGHNAVLRATLSRMQVPYVLLCHCEQPPPARRNVAAAREVFARAALVGMVSLKLRAVSEAHLGTPIANVRAFHNPVNLERIEYLPWPALNETLKLAFVGRLDPVKNLGALITALSSHAWRTRNWSLTVCGVGPDRAQLEQRVRDASLADRIRFAGFIKDIAGLWSGHHALVMPSRFEGVPLAMIEAMLCGRPVIATNIGGISEWIDEGRCGWLIRRPEPQDIEAALEKLWSSRDQLEAMGRHAHERTLQRRDADPARTLLGWLRECAMRARRDSTADEASCPIEEDAKMASSANR